MKRLAALNLAVASVLSMSSPTYALPAGGLGGFLKEGAGKVAEKVAGQVAEKQGDTDSGGTAPIVGGVVLLLIACGIYGSMKNS